HARFSSVQEAPQRAPPRARACRHVQHAVARTITDSRRASERLLGLEQRAKAWRFEQVASQGIRACALVEPQLVADQRGLGVAARRRLAVLGDEPVAKLGEAGSTPEDAADDELRRHRAVPVVLLEAERDVVKILRPQYVDACSLAERDCTAAV